ncbi:thioredoxin family protein [Marinobacter salinexigens]|uniref:Thioredoxin family protein n=1 Tax=Marinobacter salinexigens TaxID=2919747 RepID=A0A5B0VB65_9GAMM|nr:thioredoxin family protein [Marinobacter salinexigens]KAA1171425.1 thioredoxin family protein [Marinobacter salinexigens]
MTTVEVLGTGCKKCVKTAEKISAAATELSLDVDVIKVTDPVKIMEYQVMSTPAVAVDGKLVHSGSIPEHDQIISWLTP